VCAFFLCLCTGRGLATSWSPAQGVLPTVLRSRKPKWNEEFHGGRPRPNFGCRAKKKKDYCNDNINNAFIVCLHYSLLGNRSQQWLLVHIVFTNRFLATDFNTRTISVTLQISLYYGTHQIFISHVKSSQIRLLVLFCTPQAYCLLLPLTTTASQSQSYITTDGQLKNFAHIDAARTRITENICYVFAIQAVHWRAGWTYRKHVTLPLLVVWRHRRHKENTAPLLLAAYVLRALPSNGFTWQSIHYFHVLWTVDLNCFTMCKRTLSFTENFRSMTRNEFSVRDRFLLCYVNTLSNYDSWVSAPTFMHSHDSHPLFSVKLF
jgi:hypothetical protein